ncbi:MAG: glycosyltransferase family 8 protein [Flavobacteriaceae bacterium]
MILHIAYSSDDNYTPFLGTSIYSLLENNSSDFDTITLHILSNNISKSNKNNLDSICEKFNSKCVFYDMSDLDKRLNGLVVKTIAISAYARLFLPEILPKEIDKIFYLDCDSIILGSFKNLWKTPMENNIIFGVEDVIPTLFKNKMGMLSQNKYINSGMLPMNIKLMRKEDSFSKIMEFMNNYNGEIPHHDQGVINSLFHNRCKIIHPKYNCITPFFLMNSKQLKKLYKMDSYYSQKELDEAISKPVFGHLTQSLITRPWYKGSTHPLKNIFLEYLEKTPWKGYQLHKDNRILNVKIAAFLFKVFPFNIYLKVLKILKRSDQ